MTRQVRWQLGAIAAAAAGLIAVSHAQMADQSAAPAATSEAAPMTEPAPTADVKAATETETVISTMPAQPVDAAATPAPSAMPQATTAAPAVEQSTQVVVVPTVVDQAAVQAKAWAALEDEPITREEVAAEAAYANQNGLIPRGEMNAPDEDKGTIYQEMADQARHARSTQQHLAKLEAKHQQFFAVEQERLNQLALAEQQRQQALAAERAAQEQQMAAQEQQPQQPQAQPQQ